MCPITFGTLACGRWICYIRTLRKLKALESNRELAIVWVHNSRCVGEEIAAKMGSGESHLSIFFLLV